MEQKTPVKVDILDLSRFFVAYHQFNGGEISQLKLQKLLYYTQAWYMVHFDKALLFDDVPEAWVNGPVYKSVYREYAGNKDAPLRIEGLSSTHFFETVEKLKLNNSTQDFLYAVLRKYGKMDDIKLVYLTHCEEPWLEARGDTPPFARSSAKISLDTMHSYYSQQISKETSK